MKTSLLCFPSAGAGAVSYRQWLNAFPPDVEVIPVELPGRGARAKEKPFTDVRALAHTLAPTLVSLMNQPYALFGHSLGALLAFEIACVADTVPVHLFVSAHRAPDCRQTAHALYNLPDSALCRELAKLGGMSEILLREPDVMSLLLPSIRADLQMTETYICDAAPRVLPCPVTAYAGIGDERVPMVQMEGWGRRTDRCFRLHALDGGHFYLQRAGCPLVTMIAAALTESVAQSSRA
jgi:medium-chain acyl-[acyl-carrier-protein] hydrolase